MALALVASSASPRAAADERLQAHYIITMTGVSVGQAELEADIAPQSYTATATGSASGIVSALVHGTASISVRGSIRNGVLVPEGYASKTTEDEGEVALHMSFDAGSVKDLMTQGPDPGADRVPITDEHRHGVIDPLSAMLLPSPALISATEDGLAPAACDRTLPIFDGRRRYNLLLGFKRVEAPKADGAYDGPVLVCGVVVQPIAGHRRDSLLIKYLAGRRDMELWLAPIGAARLAAPLRIAMPTLVGTLEIRATSFTTSAAAPTPR